LARFLLPLKCQPIIKHIGPAFTIALLGSIESLLSAVVSDGMIGGRHRSNTELIAQGVANIGSGLFGGIPATGAIARTATNVKNGGRTPVAGIVHAIVLLIIMLFAGKWAGLIPLSVLAGILMVVAYNMSGMVLAAILFMKRMADVSEVKTLVNYPSEEVDDAAMVNLELPSNCIVYEVSGPMFFGVANKFKELMHNIPDRSTMVIIRMRNVPMIDATGVHNFKALLQRFIHQHKQVLLTGVNPEVAEAKKQHGIWQQVGDENICPLFEDAVSKVRELALLNKAHG
jgi:SulP family sulfate permease